MLSISIRICYTNIFVGSIFNVYFILSQVVFESPCINYFFAGNQNWVFLVNPKKMLNIMLKIYHQDYIIEHESSFYFRPIEWIHYCPQCKSFYFAMSDCVSQIFPFLNIVYVSLLPGYQQRPKCTFLFSLLVRRVWYTCRSNWFSNNTSMLNLNASVTGIMTVSTNCHHRVMQTFNSAYLFVYLSKAVRVKRIPPTITMETARK